uniref:non-specific serine/threonine protein kinase n=1 Tax=Cyanothece sp. (strain PCC 7425 / ATCC 29141) TaxID=395961 RepID=B8HJY8_CYAP4
MISQLIDNRYQILRLLGTGGFGQTYLAQDLGRASKPLCIIKHLKPASHDPGFLEKLEQLYNRQVDILGKLGIHDRLPTLVAHFREEQDFFLVHDFIEGHTLDNELRPQMVWQEFQVTDFLKEMLVILNFVHGQGVVHGDIQAENIIRRYRDSKLALVDFVTIRQEQIQMQSEAGQIFLTIAVSTPGYKDEGEELQPQFSSDIYNLGLVAIRSLTGMAIDQLPRHPDSGEILWEPQSSISVELEHFINTMVQPQPEARYQSAAEALRVLQRLTEFYDLPAPGSADTFVQTETELLPPTDHSSDSMFGALLEKEQLQQIEPLLSPQSKASSGKSASETALPLQQPLVLGGLALALGLLVYLGFALLRPPQQDWQKVLDQAQAERSQKKYPECIQLADTLPPEQQLYNQAQSLAMNCQLDPAQDLARVGKLSEAIALLGKIPAGQRGYQQAQQLMGQWSDSLLAEAAEQYRRGDLNIALATLQQIPASSPVSKQAQEAAASWQQESQTNNQYLVQSRAALDGRKWQEAIDLVDNVKLLGQKVPRDSAYWKQTIEPIVQNAETELQKVNSGAFSASPSPDLSPTSPSPEASPSP